MCTGIEIALLAGTALSAGSAIMQGQQAKQTADVNAELARRQGAADQDAAVAQAEKIRKAARMQAGEANAALAASGVSLGEGSALRINQDINQRAEQDAYSTLLTGTRQQRSANEQASLTEWQGSNSKTAGYLNAGASLLAGGARAYGAWSKAGVYDYTNDGSGSKFSATGAAVRARR